MMIFKILVVVLLIFIATELFMLLAALLTMGRDK